MAAAGHKLDLPAGTLCGYRRHILAALSASLIDYDIVFECTGVTGVQLAVESGLAIAATSSPLILPNWQIIETGDRALPPLGNVVIELRQSGSEPAPAVRFFADELRRQVLAR